MPEDTKKPDATSATPPASSDDDLLQPWETEGSTGKGETLQALEDLIVQEDPELADPEADGAKAAEPARRKSKPKKPAPSADDDELEEEEEDLEDVEPEEEEEEEIDDEEKVADSEADDEELEEIDLPMDAIVEVPVAGKMERVTLSEAIEGYQRQSDYTKKTQALAESRKGFTTEVESTLKVREELGQQLRLLEQALAEDGTPPAHWAELRKENPEQFGNEYAAFEARNAKLKQVRAFMEKQQEDAVSDLQKVHNARLVDERSKLTEAIPEWTDDTVFDEALDQIQSYLTKTYGASEKELAQIYDHRFILMARDAMLYRRARSKGKATLEKSRKKGGARILKPGTTTLSAKTPKGKSKKRVKAFTRARTRLSQSGSVVDAAAALLSMEDE